MVPFRRSKGDLGECPLVFDQYVSDPAAKALRWALVWVVTTPNGNYQGLITVGAGRGQGFSIPDLAERITRRIEATFNLPAARCNWGIRLLSPSFRHEGQFPYDPTERIDRGPVPMNVERMDYFRVEDYGTIREAVATAVPELADHLEGVLYHLQPLPPMAGSPDLFEPLDKLPSDSPPTPPTS